MQTKIQELRAEARDLGYVDGKRIGLGEDIRIYRPAELWERLGAGDRSRAQRQILWEAYRVGVSSNVNAMMRATPFE